MDHKDAALDELMVIYREHRHETGRKRWAEPRKSGKEVDQLAVGPDGRLVLIELKDASKRTSDVYYAPFQLLRYVWEWHNALDDVRGQLRTLLDARVKVGLTGPGVAGINGGIRAAVCFGPDKRTDEVKRRYDKALGIVNVGLPDGVGPIETWAYEPHRVA